MTQEFVFETDDLVSFELMLRSICEVMFSKPKTLNIKTKHHHWPDGGKIARRKEDDLPPTRMLIATIDDYEAGEEDIVCSGLGDMLDKLMKMVRDADPEKFLEEFGSGFNHGFNRNDGHIAHGYRMEWSPNGGWDLLHISMVHAYYGK